MTGRKWVRRAAIGGAALALLYGGAWYAIADRLENIVADWTTERRAQGWIASYRSMRLEGFPFAWRAYISEPKLATPGDVPGFRWAGPAITLDWQPWRPRRIGFSAGGGHRFDLIDISVAGVSTGTVRQADGQMLYGGDGALARLTLALDDTMLGETDSNRIAIDRLTASLDTAPPPRKEATAGKTASLRLTGTLNGLILPKNAVAPLGRTIGRIEIDATLMGRMRPAIPGGAVREILAAWRDEGGIIEIDRFDLGWSRLILESSGTLALDAGLQPIVATSATIRGHGETLNALVGAGMLRPGEALMARMAFGLLQRGGRDGGPPEINIAVSIQNGWLYVGPVRLLRVAPIKWR